MANHVPPKKNDTNGYVTYVSLISQANGSIFQANPTLAAGDVKIAIDDGVPANLGTLPAVDADFTKRVKVVLSQAETNGDVITVIFSDAAGDEWCDLTFTIHTSAQTLDELDAVADGIQTDLSNATDGLGALKALIDTLDTVADGIKSVTDNLPDGGALSDLAAILTDTGTTLPATLATIAGYIDTEVQAIIDDLGNATDGLGALKALIDAVQATANTIEGYTDLIDHATNGLAAIKAEVEGIGGVAMRGTDSAALASSWTAALATILGNFSAARIGYLDQLDFALQEAIAALPTASEIQTEMEEDGASVLDTLQDRLTAARAGYLDELAAANIPADVDTIKAKTDNLPSGIAKNVALSNLMFTMVLLADGKTPATGKTVTAQISKDGAAFANCANAVAEVSNGWYKINLTQAEMNADIVALKFTETDCLQRNMEIPTT